MRISILMLLVLALVGCSTAATQQGLSVSGESLVGVGNQFVAAANLYQGVCKPTVKVGMEKFCPGFKTFAPKFKATYPSAVAAWKAAVAAQDIKAAQGAVAAVATLGSELAVIAAEAVINLGGK